MRHLRSLDTVIGTLAMASAMLAPTLASTPSSLAAPSVARLWHPLELSPPKDAGSDPIAEFNAISCVSATECMAGGRYDSDMGMQLAIVDPEFKGKWTRAHTLVMPKNADTANAGGAVNAIACPASRKCVAVGTYRDVTGANQGFVAVQASGKWQQAQEISRPADLAASGKSALSGVSCLSPGNCVAVGGYDSKAGFAMMAAREVAGHWKRAFGLRNPASAGKTANPFLNAVSCWAPGHCAAVGEYADKSDHAQALAIVDTSNRWAQATKITLPANAAAIPDAGLFGVSCVRSGQCTAAGGYEAGTTFAGMATSLGKHGWLRATEIALPQSASSFGLNAISCTGPASCIAAGSAGLKAGGDVPVVATQTNGHWARANTVSPPANALGSADADTLFNGVSCSKGNACTAAGWYLDKADNIQLLVSSRPAA